MNVRDFWTPTAAAAARMADLNIRCERRQAPHATMYYGCELPEEFVAIRRGNPAEPTLVGLTSEPTAKAIMTAAEIAIARLSSRPGCGSPDGQTAHDDGVAISALEQCGFSRPVYKGERLPWWHHHAFSPARAAAFRAATSSK
jgi:hypothetical protein